MSEIIGIKLGIKGGTQELGKHLEEQQTHAVNVACRCRSLGGQRQDLQPL